ncbi:MATE family efflux transporter [Microbacterium gorillae]|uniref:MATE family efflux transporter n=1 Tax=Microbacterium gorillae TaxID=1231063 RepID=UPI0006942CEB|nr:MATE family efflux transporter [Microbacterium gorillae]
MSTTLTTGSAWRVILRFSVPLLIGNVVQQLYQFVDAVVVGRTLGVDALGSVGATGSLLFLLLGFAWGMTSGFAIPTAQAYGAGDMTAVRRSVASGAILSLITSVVLTIAAPLLARPGLELLGTPPELLDGATVFAQVSFLGTAALMLFNFLSAVIRAIGDSRTPLVFLTISCALNVVLVLLIVAIWNGGVGGAALATVISQAVSVILCLVYVRRRLPVLHVRREDWKVTRGELLLHLRLGLPMGFQASIIAIGALAVQAALNGLGADAVAAYTTGSRVDGLAVALLQSLGLAVSMYVAQNYGAGRPDRIRRGVVQALIMGVIGAVVLGALLIAFGSFMVRLFVGDGSDEVVEMAHLLLIVNGATYVILAVLFVLRGALQGLGRTLVPTVTGFIELIMRVGAAVIAGGLFGYVGVVFGNPLAWIGAVIVLIPTYIGARRALAELPVTPADGVITDTMPISIGLVPDNEAVVGTMLPQPVTGAIMLTPPSPRRRPRAKR